MDAANRPNNTRMQELLCLHKAQSTSLRRGRPEFFRQDSPHSIAALSIENDTAKESAINVAVVMVELEDSPPLIVAKSPEVTADAERPTINKLEQDQPQEKVEEELPTYIAASALKSSLKKKNCEMKRSIHFYESVAIACIPTLDEYTPSELQAIYYSPEEELGHRYETKSLIRVLRAAAGRQHAIDDNVYCGRGLESHLLSAEEKQARRAKMTAHVYSVVQAQFAMLLDQEDDVDVDDDVLAIISLNSSHASRKVANERAANDEAQVKLMQLQQQLQKSKAHMAAQAEAQQQRIVAVRRASMTDVATGASPVPQRRSNGSVRAACA